MIFPNHKGIKLQIIPKVSDELETLVVRCDSEWENDALRLRADLLAISGSFFQLEFDRINEKLNLLTFEKEKLRDLMRIRLKYLDAARDFITSTDSSIDVTQMATPSDRHPDVENLVSIFLLFPVIFSFDYVCSYFIHRLLSGFLLESNKKSFEFWP
ncbi:hypothetical protein ANCCAN_13024 [Ancylostoma caninum]|uniref:Uncharacterized protein n=1 Tax=Ancylostoma caninum TaxID=29170 RepID=A0A368GDZ5_ANCCA|nr:hypothetical protein ANCCAN_13024 [Ancylostoma caninum]